MQNELRAVLPVEATIKLRHASDPLLDAWKGAAQWATETDHRQHFVTRSEYQERGSEYMKEHDQGNLSILT